MFEVTVTIKDSDQTLNRKFLVYEENVQLNHEDKKLNEIVEATLKDFQGDPDDIILKIKMTW